MDIICGDYLLDDDVTLGLLVRIKHGFVQVRKETGRAACYAQNLNDFGSMGLGYWVSNVFMVLRMSRIIQKSDGFI